MSPACTTCMAGAVAAVGGAGRITVVDGGVGSTITAGGGVGLTITGGGGAGWMTVCAPTTPARTSVAVPIAVANANLCPFIVILLNQRTGCKRIAGQEWRRTVEGLTRTAGPAI